MSPFRIMKVKSDIIREEAYLRKKQYDSIYFKKHKRDQKPTLVTPLYKKNLVQ